MSKSQLFADSGAVTTAEQAVSLLRRMPLSALLCYFAGSAPFALLALLFWSEITNYRASESVAAADAAALTVGLVWMNAWRSAFAGRLRRELTGVEVPRQKRFRLAALSAFLAATKLVAVPLAALTVLALAPVVTFYRYASILAARGDLDAVDVVRRAAQLARREQRLGWAVLPFVALLQLIAALNAAVFLAFLPQLAKILTGYESAFSRSGGALVSNPLFAAAAWMVAWAALDPFVQAVYGVMCFRAESMESGEDIRVGLRRLRKAALALSAGLLLMISPLRAANAVSPQELRQSIHNAVQSHEYDWRIAPDSPDAKSPSWLLKATNAVFNFLVSVIKAIGRGIDALVRWIFGQQSMPTPEGSGPPATALHWSVSILCIVVVALALWLLWRMRRARATKPRTAALVLSSVHLESEDLSPDRLLEDQWLEMAENCLHDGNFRLALRALYLANLSWLGRREMIAIHPGKTNREYENELRRRARGLLEARELFASNIKSFERAWYGGHSVNFENVAEFRGRNLRMKALLDQPAGEAA